jgi:RimJ/RimL family protein N-acetyltransferase
MTPNRLVHFEKARLKHKDIIFAWLSQPHVQAFWDNSQAHKDDIVCFIEGRKVPSGYAIGQYVYWIAAIENHPYALIMTIKENQGENREPIKAGHISQTGATYSLDYMIGDPEYIGKGLGAPTLGQFLVFFQAEIDPNADTFFIDPDATNPRARHVYEKAGFQFIGNFILGGAGVFAGRKTHFMVKKLPLKSTSIYFKDNNDGIKLVPYNMKWPSLN